MVIYLHTFFFPEASLLYHNRFNENRDFKILEVKEELAFPEYIHRIGRNAGRVVHVCASAGRSYAGQGSAV
jgi:hypothetical protein